VEFEFAQDDLAIGDGIRIKIKAIDVWMTGAAGTYSLAVDAGYVRYTTATIAKTSQTPTGSNQFGRVLVFGAY
jgi:hypothetical protein